MICINCGEPVRDYPENEGELVHVDGEWYSCRIAHPEFGIYVFAEAWLARPHPDQALSFDEAEAAGLDGTLRSIG